MNATPSDPIIAEVRAARDKHASKFGYDLRKIFRDIKIQQEKSGRQYVKYPSRPPSQDVVAGDAEKHVRRTG